MTINGSSATAAENGRSVEKFPYTMLPSIWLVPPTSWTNPVFYHVEKMPQWDVGADENHARSGRGRTDGHADARARMHAHAGANRRAGQGVLMDFRRRVGH